jgi:ribosomal protein L2
VDSVNQVNTNAGFDFLIAPNPVNANTLTIKMSPSSTTIYYAWVYDEVGRTVYMWPAASALTGAGMNISALPKGTYVLKIMDEANKEVVSKKFIKK